MRERKMRHCAQPPLPWPNEGAGGSRWIKQERVSCFWCLCRPRACPTAWFATASTDAEQARTSSSSKMRGGGGHFAERTDYFCCKPPDPIQGSSGPVKSPKRVSWSLWPRSPERVLPESREIFDPFRTLLRLQAAIFRDSRAPSAQRPF